MIYTIIDRGKYINNYTTFIYTLKEGRYILKSFIYWEKMVKGLGLSQLTVLSAMFTRLSYLLIPC